MHLSPDEVIFWQYGAFKLNATIVYTWGLMLLLVVGSKWITRHLSTSLTRSRWQNFLEIIVTSIETQIEEVGIANPRKISGFSGNVVSVCCCREPLHHRSRLRTANRIAFHNGSSRAMCVCGDSDVWYRGTWPAWLPENLHRTDDYYASV